MSRDGATTFRRSKSSWSPRRWSQSGRQGACVYCRTTTWRTVPGSTCSSSPAAGERGVSYRTTASSAGFASGSARLSWQLRCARAHSCTVRPVCSITAAPRLTGNHSIACNRRFRLSRRPGSARCRGRLDRHLGRHRGWHRPRDSGGGATAWRAVARATARYMEYPYPETNHRRV